MHIEGIVIHLLPAKQVDSIYVYVGSLLVVLDIRCVRKLSGKNQFKLCQGCVSEYSKLPLLRLRELKIDNFPLFVYVWPEKEARNLALPFPLFLYATRWVLRRSTVSSFD